MARSSPLIHSFNAGEVSIAGALARVDQQKLKLAAEVQENIFGHVIGKGLMRPGGTYLGASKSNNQARAIPFVRSLTQKALLELTDAVLRVWVDDALVTRAAVTSTVTNGDFGAAGSWTLTATNATATISGGVLTLACPNRGTNALAKQQVSTSSAGTQHALRIDVTRGPVTFECGSTDGGDDYITRTTLETGLHSLAFTPSGSYWIRFSTQYEIEAIVTSVTVESAGVMEITAPWSASQLRNIQYTQSLDVMWLAHTSWQTRKVERRGDASWSLVLHKLRDGPFVVQSTFESKVTLTPGAAYGNTTLAASGNVFKSTDVGSLYRIGAQGFNSTYNLAAAGAATEPMRVSGIGTLNTFSYVISGTFVGTWSLQTSTDGPNTGFIQQVTGTGTVSTTLDQTSEFDNVIFWVKVVFTVYTSGVLTAQLALGSTVGGGWGGFSQPVTAAGGGTAGGVDGIFRVTAYSSATSVSVEVLQNPSSLGAAFDWQRGEFSDRRGWAAAVGLHDGRLWLGRDDRPPGSVSDDYDSFDVSTADLGDAASIQKNLATSSAANKIVAFLPLQRLIAMTDAAEIPARSSAFDSPLTPTSCSFKDASSIGAAAYSPAKMDKRGFFISRSGVRLYQLYYNFEAQDYDADDLNEFNTEIGEDGGFIEIAVQRHPEPYVWVVKGDGEVAVLLFSPKHGIIGWQRFVTTSGDEVESVAVLPVSATQDRVYLFVKRSINGSTVRYLEKIALHSEALGAATTKLWDCGVYYASVSGTTATGLTHLEGETVGAWGNGKVLSSALVVSGGQVTLPVSDATNVFIGLPYTGRYKSSKLAYGVDGGSALLEPKIVSEVGLLAAYVHKSAIKVGPSFSALTDYTIREDSGSAVSDSAPVKTTHDAPSQALGGTWRTDSRVHLTIQPGHPATLLGLVVKLKANQK